MGHSLMDAEDVFAIFFGNNQLSVIVKHDDIIYQLVTIEDIVNANPQITWQTLVPCSDDATFANNRFQKIAGDMRHYKYMNFVKNLDDELLAMDKQIDELDKEYEDRLLAASDSFKRLKSTRNEYEDEYLNGRANIMQEKLLIINQIKSKSYKRRDLLENKLSLTQRNVAQINQCIDKLNMQINKWKIMRSKRMKKLDVAMEIQSAEIKLLADHKAQDVKHDDLKDKLDDDLKDIKCKESNIAIESFQNALKIKEKQYKEWSTNDVIEWMLLIENGLFDNDKYCKMMIAIQNNQKLQIDGNSLKDLQNDSLLKLISDGCLDKSERKILIENVDRVLNVGIDEQPKNGCTICVDGKINSVFIPCGHQAACFACYEKDNNRFRKCPICRKEIADVIKTFMNGF